MKAPFPILFALIFLMITQTQAQTVEDFANAWDKEHISTIFPSNVRHKDLQNYLEKLKTLGLKVEEVGRSFNNREIYQVEFGKGATRIFMWSQMHGDEPTATSALIDLFAFLQKNREVVWVKKLEETFTIRMVPMLNPDGAEAYTRRNAQSIDINRDARALQSPEGRLLKKLRDDWSPQLGFNLHNQNSLTTVDGTSRQATISVLAVNGNPKGKSDDANQRSKRLCSVMILALENFIKGNIARYDDTYNPRAFGDMFSAWGTPVILVETGALQGKDEMFLIKLNFIAFLSAFQALADKSEAKVDSKIYEKLPFNGSGEVYSAIFRGAAIVNFAQTQKPIRADIAINAERRRAGEFLPMFIQEIGDLSDNTGLVEYDASGFYVVTRTGSLHIGSIGEFFFFKKDRSIDWNDKDFLAKFPPDAQFVSGKWMTGENLIKKIR